jgi:hypothetical protein
MSNLLIDFSYLKGQEVQLSQLTLQEKTVMISQGPLQRLGQLLSFLFHPPLGQESLVSARSAHLVAWPLKWLDQICR